MAFALIACFLIVGFSASVTALIPLYAIGVFLSFTLSQAGMAVRWWKSGRVQPGTEVKERGSAIHYDSRWLLRMIINSLGAFCAAVVVIVFGMTKFSEGTWVVLILIPALSLLFEGIHAHYAKLSRELSLEGFGEPPPAHRHRVILLVNDVHRGTINGLRYAQVLSEDVTALHVSLNSAENRTIQEQWEKWGKGVRLVILFSRYRLFVEPILQYIEEIFAQLQSSETITIVVPQLVPQKWYHNLLHPQTAMILRFMLLFKKGIVITDLPYHADPVAA